MSPGGLGIPFISHSDLNVAFPVPDSPSCLSPCLRPVVLIRARGVHVNIAPFITALAFPVAGFISQPDSVPSETAVLGLASAGYVDTAKLVASLQDFRYAALPRYWGSKGTKGEADDGAKNSRGCEHVGVCLEQVSNCDGE
jgi:hypothetical protein